MIFSVARHRGRASSRSTLGIVKSMFPEPQGHGLAVLEAVGVCFVIWMLAYTQRQKETVEADLRRSEERLRALVQHASDVIMVLQPDGDGLVHEPGARCGCSATTSLDRIGTEILPDDELERAGTLLRELMAKPGRRRVDRAAAASTSTDRSAGSRSA